MRTLSRRDQGSMYPAPGLDDQPAFAQGSYFGAAVALLALLLTAGGLQGSSSAQLYRSSVTATDYDFILDTDPNAFLCLEFKTKGYREMPDKRGGGPLIKMAFIFVAYFSDGTQVDIALDEDFATETQAKDEALRYTSRLGHLPTSLRRGVKRLVVHKGGRDTTAFSDEGLITVYSANATRRIATHDLEETIFHESVHAAWDNQHANSEAWKQAQADDGAFITRYAKNNPRGEDLAESALFAYTLIHFPGRLPIESADRVQAAIPTRIQFVRGLLPPDEPLFFQVAQAYACDGSGSTFTVSESRFLNQPKPRARTAARVELQEPIPDPNGCTVDLSVVGQLSDVVSNALMSSLEFPESDVRPFLEEAKLRFVHADNFIRATAIHFNIEPALLWGEVEVYRHCNCEHPISDPNEASEPGPRAATDAGETSNSEAALPRGRPSDDRGAAELKPLLYAAVSLLGLLLMVNLYSLRLLVRQSKS